VTPLEELLEILVCPVCKGDLDLDQEEHVLVCARCQQRYPISDGVPVMLVNK
jgi:uncharacterized protein